MFPVEFVCLSFYQQHYSKSYKWIVMKFQGGDKDDVKNKKKKRKKKKMEICGLI